METYVVYAIIVFAIIFFAGNSSKKKQNNNSRTQATAKPNQQARPMAAPPNRPTPQVGGHDDCNTGFVINKFSTFNDLEHPKLEEGVGVVARRMEAWSKPTSGCRVVRCCYCGAINEINHQRGNIFKCYFCWKRL